MIKKYLAFFILIGLLLIAYKSFNSYSPSIIKQIKEVQGISTSREIIPYPKNSEVTSETHSEKYDQVALKTSINYKKIGEFYKNILLESGWRLKAEEINDVFNILKFKKDKTTVKIISTINDENEPTTMTIEMSQE